MLPPVGNKATRRAAILHRLAVQSLQLPAEHGLDGPHFSIRYAELTFTY